MFNAGPYGIPGTSDAVNNGNLTLGAWYPDPEEPGAAPGTLIDAFTMTNHPSYRLAIEMAPERLDDARIVISTGQGGNPGGRHYSDLVDDWITGRTVALPFTRGSSTSTAVLLEAIRAGTAPAAILTTDTDLFLALASIVAEELYASPLPLCALSETDFARLRSGDHVRLTAEGVVEVARTPAVQVGRGDEIGPRPRASRGRRRRIGAEPCVTGSLETGD